MVLAGGVAPPTAASGNGLATDLFLLDEPGRAAVLDALPRMAAVLARAADPR